MKKGWILLLVLSLGVCLAACAKETVQDTTAPTQITTQESTAREPSTTALNEDVQKSEALSAAVLQYFDGEGVIKESTATGTFQYQNDRGAATAYQYERELRFEQLALDSAEAFVQLLRDYYGEEITQEFFDAVAIGGGDNGIDSVRYEAVYVNAQNQTLTVYLDSDATVSFVDCTFTW